MNVVCLRVFVTESSRHDGKPTYEWLLDTAQRQVSTPQAQIDELGKHFQERLAVLQHPTAPQRFANVMAAKGRAKKAPIAGKTY
jgi:hypothetical protein